MNHIRKAHNMIAMEALQTGLPITLGSPTFIKVKGVARAIAEWAKEKVRPELRVLPVTYNKVTGNLEKSNFSDLSDVKLTVPGGLKGHMNAYVEGVFEAFLCVENISAEVLVPFSTWLSIRLASPGSLADVSAVKDLKNYAELPVSKAHSILSGFVDPNSRRTQLAMKEVYPSITVMKTSWDNINALATRYLETNPSKVLKLVNEISSKIDRLIAVIEAMPEKDARLSAQTATILSGICAQMAEGVDLYGQIGVLVRELAVCGCRQVEEIKEPAKRSGAKPSNMALESLDLGNGMMLEFGGHNIEYSQLIRIIDSSFIDRKLIPIEELEWVIEEGLAEAVLEPDMSGWENRMVYTIEREDGFFPVANPDVIAVAKAAGHLSVSAVNMTYDDLIAAIQSNR